MRDSSIEPTKSDLARDTFSGLVARILKIRSSERWREWGYRSFNDWARNFVSENRGFIKRARIYDYLRIAERLSDLSPDDLEQIGVEKCAILARQAGRGGRPKEGLVVLARTAISVAEFRRAVARGRLGGGGRLSFGEHLDPSFRGLQYGPTNEQGVVFLFGMVAEELGFIVECVRSRYPDCLAKRLDTRRPERWKPVRIEFEFRSSNFDHPPEGADLIVCWEDDLKGKSRPEALELRSEIKRLPRESWRSRAGD